MVVGGGSKARPRTAYSHLFLPCPSDTTSLGKLLQTNQGHDPPLNLPSNWEGQMYPRDLMRENVSRNVCKCWNRGQMYSRLRSQEAEWSGRELRPTSKH